MSSDSLTIESLSPNSIGQAGQASERDQQRSNWLFVVFNSPMPNRNLPLATEFVLKSYPQSNYHRPVSVPLSLGKMVTIPSHAISTISSVFLVPNSEYSHAASPTPISTNRAVRLSLIHFIQRVSGFCFIAAALVASLKYSITADSMPSTYLSSLTVCSSFWLKVGGSGGPPSSEVYLADSFLRCSLRLLRQDSSRLRLCLSSLTSLSSRLTKRRETRATAAPAYMASMIITVQIDDMNSRYQSNLLLEVVEVVGIDQPLQKAVDVFKVGGSRRLVLHAAAHYIAGRLLRVELPAQLAIQVPVDRRVALPLPHPLELLKVLETQAPDPLVESAWVAQPPAYAFLCPFVVEDVLILSIAEVAEDVLGVFRGLAGPLLCLSKRNYFGTGSYLVEPKHLYKVLSVIVLDLPQDIVFGGHLRRRLGLLDLHHLLVDGEHQFVRSEADSPVERRPLLQVQVQAAH